MKQEWLLQGAIVPVDVETTAALVAEIKRLALAPPDLTAENMQALREKKFKAAQLSLWATSVTNAPPIQVSPLEFVTRVAGREEATGPPTLWTQWPTPKIDPNQWAFDHGLEST